MNDVIVASHDCAVTFTINIKQVRELNAPSLAIIIIIINNSGAHWFVLIKN